MLAPTLYIASENDAVADLDTIMRVSERHRHELQMPVERVIFKGCALWRAAPRRAAPTYDAAAAAAARAQTRSMSLICATNPSSTKSRWSSF